MKSRSCCPIVHLNVKDKRHISYNSCSTNSNVNLAKMLLNTTAIEHLDTHKWMTANEMCTKQNKW
jgi:glyceraldehyde-3-phosphate dehydrogenase/erythrose-4-phosphate dehydrogenase